VQALQGRNVLWVKRLGANWRRGETSSYLTYHAGFRGVHIACISLCVHAALGLWGRICRKRLRIEARLQIQWDTNRNWHVANQLVTCHVTLRGQGRGDPNMFGALCLKNGWKFRLGYNRAPIGNCTWGIRWCSMASRDPKGQGRGADIFGCQYIAER